MNFLKIARSAFAPLAVFVFLFSSVSNAQLGNPLEPNCAACDGKIDNIIFKKEGFGFPSFIEIQSRKGKRFASLYAGYVSSGQQFSISGASNFLDNKGTLGATIYISFDGGAPIALHTSCSEPFGPGTRVESLVVISATSRNGGLTCPVDDVPTPPGDA
ncbi:hypothetical protein NBRC116583_11420 [Arenicella sp. 4NH20-0111]|uniref:hypothetical protein n=1 Tax=Arenicella sp. 4NH20-0111 TaxID=3127648 RepID=UPI00310C2BB5